MVSGDVHIILGDGAHLNATQGIIVEGTNSLTIYAQSTGANMGKLTATGGEYAAGIGGGNQGSGGSIYVLTEVNATGNGGADAIGNGNSGSGGSGIRPTADTTDVNVYEVFSDNVSFYNATLHCDITIPADATLNIPDEINLTIPKDMILANNGVINNYGTVSGEGKICNYITSITLPETSELLIYVKLYIN